MSPLNSHTWGAPDGRAEGEGQCRIFWMLKRRVQVMFYVAIFHVGDRKPSDHCHLSLYPSAPSTAVTPSWTSVVLAMWGYSSPFLGVFPLGKFFFVLDFTALGFFFFCFVVWDLQPAGLTPGSIPQIQEDHMRFWKRNLLSIWPCVWSFSLYFSICDYFYPLPLLFFLSNCYCYFCPLLAASVTSSASRGRWGFLIVWGEHRAVKQKLWQNCQHWCAMLILLLQGPPRSGHFTPGTDVLDAAHSLSSATGTDKLSSLIASHVWIITSHDHAEDTFSILWPFQSLINLCFQWVVLSQHVSWFLPVWTMNRRGGGGWFIWTSGLASW